MLRLIVGLSSILCFLTPIASPAQSGEDDIETMREKAEKGDLESQNNLGYSYSKGDGVEKDIPKAISWYRKAAEGGYAKSQSNLGNCYLAGAGVPKDTVQALLWLEKAAVQGYAKAQYNMGVLYEKGGRMLKRDTKKAAEWYMKAANQGYGNAFNNLAGLYMAGDGVPMDWKEAFKWSKKGSEHGNVLSDVSLGQFYLSGIPTVIEKDRIKAYHHLRLAATKLSGLPELDALLEQAKPQNQAEWTAKMSDDLCTKFTGHEQVEPNQRSFLRIQFYAKQLFDADYPDYQQLMKSAPKVKAPDLQKSVLTGMFETCPAYGAKFGFDNVHPELYQLVNDRTCDCFTKDLGNYSIKIGDEKAEEHWQMIRQKCALQFMESTDSVAKNTIEAIAKDLQNRKPAKTDKETKEQTHRFLNNLYGSFMMQCAAVRNLYAQYILDANADAAYEFLLFTPERMGLIQNVVMPLKQNNKKDLAKAFKNEESFKNNQSVIAELMPILKKQPKIAPMLSKQEMTQQGFIEEFTMLSVETKAVEYQIKLIYDKLGDMDELIGLEYIPKNKIPKKRLKDLENKAASMSIARPK
jgi:TPR repeat protein